MLISGHSPKTSNFPNHQQNFMAIMALLELVELHRLVN